MLVYGVDSVQALELALVGAGKLLASSPEFRAGQIESLGQAAREPAALMLPLPLHSLQLVLSGIRSFLDRTPKAGANPEWRRSLLGAMRETSADLATLAASVSVRGRPARR